INFCTKPNKAVILSATKEPPGKFFCCLCWCSIVQHRFRKHSVAQSLPQLCVAPPTAQAQKSKIESLVGEATPTRAKKILIPFPAVSSFLGMTTLLNSELKNQLLYKAK
ncbi:MAG: hypothetical protein K2X48_07825, partial [Chitinophagaceae bacterium]|nr:hypothetical protein [Chitinophagaceae bacterium]